MPKRFSFSLVITLVFSLNCFSQNWIVRDSILKFPNGFSSWLKRNNGGVDSASPGPGNSQGAIGSIGTNQGVAVFDFNKDGKPDLIFQLFPSNNITRQYLRGIFIQQNDGNYLLDTSYVIKGKGDMWYGGFGDFNGDGLIDYHYITENYHGADSNRIYNPEMVKDNWPERVFINNGKSFDTLSLDVNNLEILSTYVKDIDGDGLDEIIAGGRDGISIYKYNLVTKKFDKVRQDITDSWKNNFNQRSTGNPIFIIPSENTQSGFSVLTGDSAITGKATPYGYNKFVHAKIDFKTATINKTYWDRSEWYINANRSNADSADYFKFNTPSVSSVYKLDINDDGNDEYIVGGNYMNDISYKKHRYAYGWKVFDKNGFDLTTSLFVDSGYDRNVELISHGLDIDKNYSGIELIPGTWGADGGTQSNPLGTIGYYYVKTNKKLERKFITSIKRFDGSTLPIAYLKARQIVQYPLYSKNQNALLTYDFQDIKRAAIVYQFDCSSSIQPTFEKPSYLICGNDSVNIKLANVLSSDTITWYVNGKSTQLFGTSINLKTPETIFVQKIDSNGCKNISNTVIINKLAIPFAPTLSRDTANNLVASINGITWYKDGNALTDTTQKIKPTTGGSYTAKTTQNGCTSPLSTPYYYLVTDIINLSADEFIKLAPNPFSNQINFDFVIKGYQRLNIEVFDIASGARVAARQNITAGTQLYLGQLSAGTYLCKVSSNDGKVAYQFKMIKL